MTYNDKNFCCNGRMVFIKFEQSISVRDDAFRFTPSCDALINGDQIHRLDRYLSFGHYTKTALTVCMMFSLVYNTRGMKFALMGSAPSPCSLLT